MNAPAPPGYSALRETEGYIALSGPYFWAKDTLGDFTYGFHSDDRHGNPEWRPPWRRHRDIRRHDPRPHRGRNYRTPLRNDCPRQPVRGCDTNWPMDRRTDADP